MSPKKVNEKFDNTAKATPSASVTAIATLPASGMTDNRENVIRSFRHPIQLVRTASQNASH